MSHSPKRAHLSAWIDADLHASMKEKFGHLKSGVSGFVEEACEAAMGPGFEIRTRRLKGVSVDKFIQSVPALPYFAAIERHGRKDSLCRRHFKRVAAVISKKAKR